MSTLSPGADRLHNHLDGHVELYHRAIRLTMNPKGRYLPLDGFVAPDAAGRSVASMVENRPEGSVSIQTGSVAGRPVLLRAFLTAVGLTEDGPVSYTCEGLARLIEQVGPVLEIGGGIANNQVSHVRILSGDSGDSGDGTAPGTTVTVADPAT